MRRTPSSLVTFCCYEGLATPHSLGGAVKISKECYTVSDSQSSRVEAAERQNAQVTTALDDFSSTAGEEMAVLKAQLEASEASAATSARKGATIAEPRAQNAADKDQLADARRRFTRVGLPITSACCRFASSDI